jgi:hypothetical protein
VRYYPGDAVRAVWPDKSARIEKCDCGQTLGGPIEKNWDERFERAQSKPRDWRVALGAVPTMGKIGQFFMSGGTDLLQSPNTAERTGAWFGDALVFVLAAWLIYFGVQASESKNPRRLKQKRFAEIKTEPLPCYDSV